MKRVLEFHRLPGHSTDEEAVRWCKERGLKPLVELARGPDGTYRGAGVRLIEIENERSGQ